MPARSLRCTARFGEVDAAGTSPLYERVAVALSESDEALRAIEAAPARKRHPTVILAALHDLALAGRAPALAAAYAAADGDAAAGAAIDTLLRMTDSVVAIAVRRQTRTNETGRCAVLYPAIAEAARRVGANAVGLIDVGCSAGLNLNVDRVGITYSNGQSLGDPSSPVQLSSSIVGDRPVPTRAMPEVVARVGVDLDPVDVTDADDARWLRACLWPDQPERPRGSKRRWRWRRRPLRCCCKVTPSRCCPTPSPVVPADALPVVTTTWALSHFPLESRLRFLHRLDEAAAGRAVAWVSAEGVGVAPAIPTLGDRRASGHSIIGLAVFDRSALRAEAIGRCWSRGRLLAWLAGPPDPRRAGRRRRRSGSNGARSSAPSPRPTSLTGMPSSRCTAITMPPLAVPSSLVSTMPVTSTTSVNTRACTSPFWPVVASSTSSTSVDRRLLLDDPLDLAQLVHQAGLVLQPAGGVDEHGVDAGARCPA